MVALPRGQLVAFFVSPLERRWHELLAHERNFRSDWDPAAAAAAR